jgi:hypothetical protein
MATSEKTTRRRKRPLTRRRKSEGIIIVTRTMSRHKIESIIIDTHGKTMTRDIVKRRRKRICHYG